MMIANKFKQFDSLEDSKGFNFDDHKKITINDIQIRKFEIKGGEEEQSERVQIPQHYLMIY